MVSPKGYHKLRFRICNNHILLYFIFPWKLNNNIDIMVDCQGSSLGLNNLTLMQDNLTISEYN
jgi:hypothetical protein